MARAKPLLSYEVKCLNFLNADLIAQGLSPLDSGAAAVKAGRLLLAEFSEFVAGRKTFACESTLSGKTYIKLLKDAQANGFRIHLHYLWLPNSTLAIARVRERVKQSGHHVPAADIRRRYSRSLQHFIDDYAPLADRWAMWDNQTSPPELQAESETCPTTQLKIKLEKHEK
jgi:predicted ABC-type ATPase